MKDDNAEIATMERQIGEMQDQIRHLQEEQSQLDQELEENQSERNQKYRELRKREENMDAFLENFETNKVQENERISELEREVRTLTEEMSKLLSHAGHLPTMSAFSGMKDDLAFKEGEMEKSRNTLEGVTREHGQLQMNLEKIEALEGKIKTEMSTLKEKMISMEEEMTVFADLDKLRMDAEEKRRILEEQKESLIGRKDSSARDLREIQEKFDAGKKELSENDTHAQLVNLEKKLSHLEQNNFTVGEFIANKKAELNFEPVRNKVLKMQWEYNKLIIKNTRQMNDHM